MDHDDHNEPKQASTEVMSEQEALIASLPPSMRDQLRNGIVDVKNLTAEQLRGLTMNGATDGGIGDLAWASRGDPKASMNNWQETARSDDNRPVALDYPEHEPVAPLNTPNLRNPRGKDGPGFPE